MSIRTPYTLLQHAQRKLSGSKIVFDQGAQMHRLMLETGETLNPEQAAQRSGIKYTPYIWDEVRPGGATYITNPTRYTSSARKLAKK